jgi:acyl-CoA thioesterase
MQKYLDFFRVNDHFARHCGIELLEVKPGYARASMVLQPFHFNGAQTAHGGAIFTLADFAFAVAVNSQGKLALAINTTMAFVNPAVAGTLFAVAEELASNRRLGTYQVCIRDEKDQLIAQFQGTAYRKNTSLLPSAEAPG